jgi:hypothetical protein
MASPVNRLRKESAIRRKPTKKVSSRNSSYGTIVWNKLNRGVSGHAGLTDGQISSMELNLMNAAEKEQIHTDFFWGLDEEAARCAREGREMLDADLLSQAMEQQHRHRALIAMWDEEDLRTRYDEAYMKATVETRSRKNYIKYFHTASSTKEIMHYKWPTRQHIAPVPFKNRESTAWNHPSIAILGSEVYQPSYEESMDAPLFGIMQMDHQSSSVVHTDSLQQTKVINAQFEEDAELSSTVLRGKNVGSDIAERARFPNAKSLDDTHGGGLAASLGLFMTKLPKGKKKGIDMTKMSDLNVDEASSAEKLSMHGQTIPHIDELDGHPVHKWDQEMILRNAFAVMDPGNTGKLDLSTFIKHVNNIHTQSLLRFTVFGAWIKLRQWHMFETIFGASSEDDEDEYDEDELEQKMVLSLEEWLHAAKAAANEECVLPQHIRTQEEHKKFLTASSPWLKILGVANKSWYAEQSRECVYRTTREAYIARRINRGDFVWGLYGAGCVWLPATVERANTDGTFDLSYPLSSRGLHEARLIASSKELLNLPSNDLVHSFAPRPYKNEEEICGYAFDLVDHEQVGAVEPQHLLAALKSNSFEKIVKSSASLYVIFGSGSNVLEQNLVESCLSLGGNGLIDRSVFIEYCLIAADMSTFNGDAAAMQ